MVWNSKVLFGMLVEIQPFVVVINFISRHNYEQWSLVTIYGPCQGEPRDIFVNWLYHLNIPVEDNWLLLGDFNFIRSIENRNLPGGDRNGILFWDN